MKISVCMAVYNGEMYLQAQVESILTQLQSADELVIVNDASQDDSLNVLKNVRDKRIRIFNNDQNLGILASFEKALQLAQGDIIFLSDQDDIWLPGKVTECVISLKKHLLVVTDCKVVDHTLNEISPSFFQLRHSGAGVIKNIWKNSYLGCCMAFRRELLTLSLPIPAKIPMHDMWLGLVAQTQGSVLFLPQKLSLYRRHQLAASPAAGKSNFNLFRKLNMRVILITSLMHRVLLSK